VPNLCDSLFNRVKRVGEFLETGPVGSALHFLDVDIDRVANVACSVYEHKGQLRVASEGHDIATHDLDQVFYDLCGRVALSGGLGERGQQGDRYSRAA
jgi:hypothetical protein